MTLNSPINMRHSKCAVQTDQFHFLSWFLAHAQTICFVTTFT